MQEEDLIYENDLMGFNDEEIEFLDDEQYSEM